MGVGGVAAILHGVPRATFDLDQVANRTDENVHITGGRDYEALLAECEEIPLADGVSARVVNLELLIRLKQETGRDKDLAVVPLLRATLEERRKLAIEEEGSKSGEQDA